MDLSCIDANGVRTIKLRGRMDLQGAAEIDMKFTLLTSIDQPCVVVDLSEVDFMASMGLATLIRGGKATQLRAGNMVLLNPTPLVRKVLSSSRIDEVLPVYSDLGQAQLAAKTPAPAH